MTVPAEAAGGKPGTFPAPRSADPYPMSEFTRAQTQALMKRASDVIRRSHEIRRDLDGVMKRIDETGSAAKIRKNAAKHETASRLFKKVITDG